MKRLRYRILTAMILLCIGSIFAVTARAESSAAISPVSEAAMQEESAEETPLPIEAPSFQSSANEETEETGHTAAAGSADVSVLPENAAKNRPKKAAGVSAADVVQETTTGLDNAIADGKNSDRKVQSEEPNSDESEQTKEADTPPEDAAGKNPEEPARPETDTNTVAGSAEAKNTDLEAQTTDAAPEMVLGTVYADNSNFQAVLQKNPETVIVTESIIWDKPFDSGAPENTAFTTDTPVEVVLSGHSITLAENSRLSFSGPFHFTGDGDLFRIGGDLFLDGTKLTANGNGTTAISFTDAPGSDGAVTRDLELHNCVLSILGTDGTGICSAQETLVHITGTVVTCVGKNSTGMQVTSSSEVSIYERSKFDVTGKNSVGMVLSEQAAGFLEFDLTVSGESSRGSVIISGDYANSGNVTVSGDNAIGIYLEEGVHRIENGTVFVSGEESTGIFAVGHLEASQLSIKAETGMAAEAYGALVLILCDIDTVSDRLLSHNEEIVLDTCRANDIPDGAVVKMRKAQPYLNGDGGYLSNAYDLGAFGFSVPVGTERLTLPDALTFSLYDAEDSTIPTIERFLPVTWERTNYNLDIIGDYTINYRAEAGGLPMEISGTVMVHVYDGSRPRLNYAVRMGDDYCELYFSPQAEDEQQIRLWVSDDEGKTWRDYIAEDKAQPWGRLGFVATDALEENTAYLLRLEIVGGTHAGISPVLSYLRSEREIKWENGDRDGGDQRPQEGRPEPSQPSSSGSHSRPGGIIVLPATETQPPWPPESQPVFLESLPEKNTASGIELTQPELLDILEANPDTVTVVSDGVKAELPAAVLKNIPLEQDESLTVLLKQPEENAFDIRIYAGDREINALGDTPIKVTVPNPGGAKQAQPQSGGAPIPAEETAEGKAVFPVSETGTYVMDVSPAKQETQNPNTKSSIRIWLSCALLLIILLLGVHLFLRKRRANL